ncbi:MAG: DNA cytosine methyltransferase [Candidatus Babeliales bacterium]
MTQIDIFYMAHAPNSPQKRWGKHHIQSDTCPTLSTDLAIKEPRIIDKNQDGNIYVKDSASTLRSPKASQNNLVVIDTKIRKLTEKECERLQAFPDNWTVGISMTQRYKCLGNAVTTSVIAHLGLLLKESIEGCD